MNWNEDPHDIRCVGRNSHFAGELVVDTAASRLFKVAFKFTRYWLLKTVVEA